MNITLKPTSIILVGTAFLFIYLCISTGIALPSSPSTPESLNKIEEFHNNFVNNEIYDKQNSNTGQLKLPGDTILFPWASRQASGLASHTGFVSTHPQKEKITLTGPQPEVQVQDLKAINAIKQRDVLYDESQRSNLSNSMEVRVQGSPNNQEQYYSGSDSLENKDPESLVDNALNSNMGAKNNPGNYLNIDISGITVSAINTVEGGSAVATSNIIIKPVQLIYGSSQACEKI